MGALQDDLGCFARFEGFLPARGAQAPLISGSQSHETELRPGSTEIVSPRSAEFEKVGGHHGADHVHSGVIAP